MLFNGSGNSLVPQPQFSPHAQSVEFVSHAGSEQQQEEDFEQQLCAADEELQQLEFV